MSSGGQRKIHIPSLYLPLPPLSIQKNFVGTQVKFRRNGMWREIKSRSRAVPSAVVPAQIADYVARNFPGTFLVGIEHTCREWEVKLNNTIELTFDDKRFALKEYDD